MLADDSRTDRVHAQHVEQFVHFDIAQGLFRLDCALVQQTSRDNDQVERIFLGYSLCSSSNTRLVQQINRRRANDFVIEVDRLARQRVNLADGIVISDRAAERPTYASRSTDDRCTGTLVK